MNTWMKLANRCEQHTGPDRELDAEIAVMVNDPTNCGGGTARYLHREANNSYADIGKYCGLLPAYTASLDAAVTLVPPCSDAGGDRWAVEVGSGFYGATAKLWHECSLKRHEGHAAGQHDAMARALAAASLRARAASADTRPQGGDSTEIEAPFTSGAVPKADARPLAPVHKKEDK